MDHIDQKILQKLQEDSSIPQRELADQIGLSQNACWRRIKAMKDSGVIVGETVRLDPAKLGMGLTVFVMLKTRQHSVTWLQDFRRRVLLIPNVVDFFRIAGEYDYMLKVVASDISDFDRVYQKLIVDEALESVTSLITMEAIANNRALPL
ncbi:Lrp/AsnC family transcriptional regulator [Neptunicoccus cionae]|uniref:Lrp/AsnC family transcriptional regulator n=1 Tax=Neptunicoccus cionae TaxID=2035344 RepID=UPI000C7834BB|nr:Lrp/AsnC family transcriptional regulator [Amylibacter cionae]PLS21406.1 transcriptional regulator [Amylibacter cionae]